MMMPNSRVRSSTLTTTVLVTVIAANREKIRLRGSIWARSEASPL